MNKIQVSKLRHFIRAILSEARYVANKTKSQKVKTSALKQKAIRTNTGPLAAIAAKIQATLDSSPALVSFMETPTGLQHAAEKFQRFRVDGSDKIIPGEIGGLTMHGGNEKEIMSSNYAWFCKWHIELWKSATGMAFDAADVASLLMAYAEIEGPKVAEEEASLVARVLPLNADSIGKLMNNINADADEPKGGPLGKIAWGEQRNDVVSKEPDTELEARLIAALKDRLTAGSNPITTDDSNDWIELLASRKYSKRVVPWKKGNIYRGLDLDAPELKALLKIVGKIPNKGSKKGTFTMTPYDDPKGLVGGAASSWTPSKQTTRGFHQDSGSYSVTLTASPAANRNRLLDVSASGIYELDQFDGFTFKREREVVGFGDIVCSEVEWEKDE
jgi:hypothetical protein